MLGSMGGGDPEVSSRAPMLALHQDDLMYTPTKTSWLPGTEANISTHLEIDLIHTRLTPEVTLLHSS